VTGRGRGLMIRGMEQTGGTAGRASGRQSGSAVRVGGPCPRERLGPVVQPAQRQPVRNREPAWFETVKDSAYLPRVRPDALSASPGDLGPARVMWRPQARSSATFRAPADTGQVVSAAHQHRRTVPPALSRSATGTKSRYGRMTPMDFEYEPVTGSSGMSRAEGFNDDVSDIMANQRFIALAKPSKETTDPAATEQQDQKPQRPATGANPRATAWPRWPKAWPDDSLPSRSGEPGQ